MTFFSMTYTTELSLFLCYKLSLVLTLRFDHQISSTNKLNTRLTCIVCFTGYQLLQQLIVEVQYDSLVLMQVLVNISYKLYFKILFNHRPLFQKSKGWTEEFNLTNHSWVHSFSGKWPQNIFKTICSIFKILFTQIVNTKLNFQ